MSRKTILAAWVVIFMAMILSIILIATSIMWIPCYMVAPELAKPLGEYATRRFMQEMSKAMFRNNKFGGRMVA